MHSTRHSPKFALGRPTQPNAEGFKRGAGVVSTILNCTMYHMYDSYTSTVGQYRTYPLGCTHKDRYVCKEENAELKKTAQRGVVVTGRYCC